MGWDASNGSKTFGPDYFSYYKYEIAELLSQDEDFLPSLSLQDSTSAKVLNGYKTSEKKKCNSASSSSLFYGCISPEVYEFKREKLKSLLRRSVFSLSQDVDEMVDPVLKLCELKSFLLRFSGSLPSNSASDAPETDQERPSKKLKLTTFPLQASESQGQDKSVREPFSYACRLECNKENEPLQPNNNKKNDDLSDARVGAAKENEVDGRLVLLQSESSIVEEGLKRVSDDLSAVLGHMEQELKELLDAVMSKCRLMTLSEKQELQRMIKNLPQSNLDSVAEIVRCQGQSDAHSCNEMHIDLEKEDNVKLWHLYFYVKAVENATKLRSASS